MDDSAPIDQPQGIETHEPETLADGSEATPDAPSNDDASDPWEDPGLKHSIFLDQLIDHGHSCALGLYVDALEIEKPELRLRHVQMAMRAADMTRRLVATFDRHEKYRADRT